MIPEMGHLALIFVMVLSFGFSINSWFVPSLFLQKRSLYVLFSLISFSLLSLFYSMIVHDFSVYYVYQHSSRNLSWWYRLSAVWGGHEGSLLLWLWMLVAWNLAVSKLQGLSETIKLSSIRIGMLFIGVFSGFSIVTSNPFIRILPFPPGEGTDLNPLLQDVGMLIHPPILYVGYVGSLMLYPLALSAIKRPYREWHQGLTTLCRIQWAVLTLGITLGSWWAYRVLGWGGVWFWDPVENVSLIPWLLQLSLLHSLKALPRYPIINRSVILLCISIGISAVLGLFLVRSGVLVSVHTFSEDPARGIVLLTIIVSMLLVAVGVCFNYDRGGLAKKSVPINFRTREGVVLAGTYLIMMVFLIVVLGTLYPVIIQALGLTMISIGAPYYNQLIVPLALVIAALMVVQSHLFWGKAGIANISSFGFKVTSSILIICCLWVTQSYAIQLGSILSAFIAFMLITEVLGYSKSIAQRLAHAGFGFVILSLSLSVYEGNHGDFILRPGEEVAFSGFKLRMLANKNIEQPNYQSTIVPIQLIYGSKMKAVLQPEKRIYKPSETIISPVGVYSSLGYDIYTSVGQPAKNGGWVMRFYYKPFQSFLWFGSALMILGVLLAFMRPKQNTHKKPQGKRYEI